MKKTLVLVSVIGLLGLTACNTIKSALTPAVVQKAIASGAAWGIQQDPTILPYLQVVQPIICTLAGSGVFDPAKVVAALDASTAAAAVKTPTGVIVVNSVLGIYEGVYYAYGANVQASVIEPYLQAVCAGLTQAVVPNSQVKAVRIGSVAPKDWPHVK